MRRTRLVPVAFSLVVALAACSGSSSPSVTGGAGPSSGPASASAPSAAPSASVEPSMSTMPSESTMPSAPASEEPSLATAVATAVDPCQLVTQEEASSLAGVSFGKGKASTLENHGRQCVYTATGFAFNVSVVQAPDQATMDAAKQQVLTEIKQSVGQGVKTTPLSGIGDDAMLLTLSTTVEGMTAKLIGIYLAKGTVFAAFSDVGLGHPVASSTDMQSQAQTIVSRLP